MSLRRTLATTARVLRRLRHDRRTVVMVLLIPVVLLTLLRYMLDEAEPVFDRVGLAMLGVLPLAVMFLVTSVAMLRERVGGTLERVLTTPLAKADLLVGYGLAFGLLAAVQGTVATAAGVILLGLDPAGPAVLVVPVAVANALLGVALGLLGSAFARTELQAVQLMPVVVMPQVLLCGMLVPRDQMAGWLEAVSSVLPMTYAVRALDTLGARTSPGGALWRDVGVTVAFAAAALLLGAVTLRRRTD